MRIEVLARVARLTDSSVWGTHAGRGDPGWHAYLATGIAGPDGRLRAGRLPVTSNCLRTWFGSIRDSGRLALGEVTTSRRGPARDQGRGCGLIVAGNEAGGWGGAESSFVLLQGVLAEGGPPVWVRGGIGPNVAAGCVAAGAAGVVLDGALLLARESPLSLEWRERIARWDGSETTVVAPGVGCREFASSRCPVRTPWRGCERPPAREARPGKPPFATTSAGRMASACRSVKTRRLADRLARKYVTVGGIVQAVERAISEGIAAARAARPLAESSRARHRPRHALSDPPGPDDPRQRRARVCPGRGAKAAACRFWPWRCCAKRKSERCCATPPASSRDVPWGVGILGFVPPELRTEQLAVVREFRPPFALFAGGRPDQAAGLEREGIATYLHVPSPGLLDQYLRDGSRRFVLEGRECGGHVGPRSSFVLWEQAVAVVGEAIDRGIPAEQVSLVFAGGIHDARSAALVAALAGPLAARGVKVGILVGTAYLFTQRSGHDRGDRAALPG